MKLITEEVARVKFIVEGMSKILNYNKINYSKKVKYKESIVLRLNSNKAKKELMWMQKLKKVPI